VSALKSLSIFFSWLTIALLLWGCPERSKVYIPDVPVQKVEIGEYGRVLFALDPHSLGKGLDSLSGEFGFFIGENVDTLQIMQIRSFITDAFNLELAGKSLEKYPDIGFLEDGLAVVFSKMKYYFPSFSQPDVFTYVSGLLYELPVHYADSVLIIAIDMFLGSDYEPYRAVGLPLYISRRMEQEHILPACSREIISAFFPDDTPQKTLLDKMILHGKMLYALDLLHPELADNIKIGYTPAQLKWCRDNEFFLWRLFLDQELLYQTDPRLNTRFILDGPFTTGLPEGAPAMLGRWLGWQIVRSYMKKQEQISLQELLHLTDTQKILSQSGYKPRK